MPDLSDSQPRDITAVIFSFVVAVRDEADRLESFCNMLRRTADGLGEPYEIIFVNDGSSDDTVGALRRLHAEDDRIRYVDLSRAFGRERAIAAGYDFARGAAVITLEADGRHPGEAVEEMVRRWRQGYEVVSGVAKDDPQAPRRRCPGVRLADRLLAAAVGAGMSGEDDFRLVDRKVVGALRATRESARFLPGLVRWVGFRRSTVEYDRPAVIEEESTCIWRAPGRLRTAGVLSFSVLPVRLVGLLGGAMAAAALLYAPVALILWPILGASLVANLVFLAIGLTGMILAALGLVGEYVGRAYEEAKGRPIYILREAVGFEPDSQPPAAVTPARTNSQPESSHIRLFT